MLSSIFESVFSGLPLVLVKVLLIAFLFLFLPKAKQGITATAHVIISTHVLHRTTSLHPTVTTQGPLRPLIRCTLPSPTLCPTQEVWLQLQQPLIRTLPLAQCHAVSTPPWTVTCSATMNAVKTGMARGRGGLTVLVL